MRRERPCLDLKFIALGKTFEARDAGLSAPRWQAKGVEMVDAIGDPEPLDQRPEAVLPEMMRTSEPSPRSCSTLGTSSGTRRLAGVAVFFEHPVEKDRKLVNHEEYGLFVMSAFVEQVLPVATPVYGIQS